MTSPTTHPLTPGNGGTPRQEIAEFVAGVRGQLDDLSVDEVTELTGGLEADLIEALETEGGSPAEHYGDPAAYARELRAAAGLPPRAAGGDRRSAGSAAGRRVSHDFAAARRFAADQRRALEALPWWDGVRDFLIVVRPAWWVLRAWIAVALLLMVFGFAPRGLVPGGFPGFVLLLVAIVGSVQLGRRSPLPVRWQDAGVRILNVIAVLALLPVLAQTSSQGYYESSGFAEQTPGLTMNGQAVTNVFPYDAQGNPLTGVQLYDQDGQPLETAEDNRLYSVQAPDLSSSTDFQLIPGSAAGAPPRWNVFPLQRRATDGYSAPTGPAEPVPPPFQIVSPLIGPTATPLGTPGTGPSPSAGASASASAGASASPSANVKPTASPTR